VRLTAPQSARIFWRQNLDEMWRRFLWDSIILATGATGTGKTLLVSKFLQMRASMIAPFYLLTKNLALNYRAMPPHGVLILKI